jgi:hypothetical protein
VIGEYTCINHIYCRQIGIQRSDDLSRKIHSGTILSRAPPYKVLNRNNQFMPSEPEFTVSIKPAASGKVSSTHYLLSGKWCFCIAGKE